MLNRVGPTVYSFHIDLVTHAHARMPLLGHDLIAALPARTTAPIGVHLLVAEPARWIDRCIGTARPRPNPRKARTTVPTAAPPIAVTELIGTTHASAVVRPGYDRDAVTAGIAHIGVGNFHRVHEALYVDACLHLPNQSKWGIVGIGLGDSVGARTKASAYAAQNYLYTVTEYSTDSTVSSRLVGAMINYLHAPADPEAVLAQLSAANIRIVSLTITEGGYNLDEATGEFKVDDPDVQHDLHAAAPRTAFGYITEALRRRRAHGIPAFTVMSCDNLRSNGDSTRTAILGFAAAKDPELAAWISANVTFPNSMVDRIAPAVTAEVKQKVNDQTGVKDQMPAIAETFTQWVLQDDFPAGRPAFEQVGVELRNDVAAFEAIKGRMLNACHMLLVYPALLSGHRLVHEAMTDTTMVDLLRHFLELDVIPHIEGPQGVSLDDYAAAVLERFANPAVGDQLLRIAGDGASKLPTFHAKTINILLAGHHDVRREALVVAGFRQYTRGADDLGHSYDVDEPHLTQIDRALLNSDDAREALRIRPFASLNLADHQEFVEQYLFLVAQIDTIGMAATTLALTSKPTAATTPRPT